MVAIAYLGEKHIDIRRHIFCQAGLIYSNLFCLNVWNLLHRILLSNLQNSSENGVLAGRLPASFCLKSVSLLLCCCIGDVALLFFVFCSVLSLVIRWISFLCATSSDCMAIHRFYSIVGCRSIDGKYSLLCPSLCIPRVKSFLWVYGSVHSG